MITVLIVTGCHRLSRHATQPAKNERVLPSGNLTLLLRIKTNMFYVLYFKTKEPKMARLS